ncbi:MAG TPA: 3-oxoacyl-ACP reductase [Candidatus Dormibacteraeota bacterium]
MKLRVKVPGLPEAPRLRRYQPGKPLVDGPVLIASAGGRVRNAVSAIVQNIASAETSSIPSETSPSAHAVEGGPESRSPRLRGEGQGGGNGSEPSRGKWGAIVFDGSELRTVADLTELHSFMTQTFRYLRPSGRLLLFGTPPEDCAEPETAATQRALDGFIRSAGKEARLGSTANLVYVGDGADSVLESTIRFFLSGRSAYVDGQVLRVRPAKAVATSDWEHPLDDRVAVVTGAARGIGAAIAETLARDRARVVVADVPAQGASLTQVANKIGGTAFQIDITAADAPDRLAKFLLDRFGGAGLFVHNAGITRDRSLVNMTPDQWTSVLNVNLQAQLRINTTLLEQNVLRDDARVVCISSTSGIAGNRGQTNYAASKAGIIGMVQAMAPAMAKRGMTINAVAPGFIETAMTKAMPFASREIGRRINSLSQGGLPIDVAETVAWLGQPGSGGVNGQVVRVCGQSMLGA